jgi:hypothetical protein
MGSNGPLSGWSKRCAALDGSTMVGPAFRYARTVPATTAPSSAKQRQAQSQERAACCAGLAARGGIELCDDRDVERPAGAVAKLFYGHRS